MTANGSKADVTVTQLIGLECLEALTGRPSHGSEEPHIVPPMPTHTLSLITNHNSRPPALY